MQSKEIRKVIISSYKELKVDIYKTTRDMQRRIQHVPIETIKKSLQLPYMNDNEIENINIVKNTNILESYEKELMYLIQTEKFNKKNIDYPTYTLDFSKLDENTAHYMITHSIKLFNLMSERCKKSQFNQYLTNFSKECRRCKTPADVLSLKKIYVDLIHVNNEFLTIYLHFIQLTMRGIISINKTERKSGDTK